MGGAGRARRERERPVAEGQGEPDRDGAAGERQEGGLVDEHDGVVALPRLARQARPDADHRADDEAELQADGEQHHDPGRREQAERLEAEGMCQHDGGGEVARAHQRLIRQRERRPGRTAPDDHAPDRRAAGAGQGTEVARKGGHAVSG